MFNNIVSISIVIRYTPINQLSKHYYNQGRHGSPD
nr:MAG TPA: hypothetical protein [Crassvirales sp.]